MVALNFEIINRTKVLGSRCKNDIDPHTQSYPHVNGQGRTSMQWTTQKEKAPYLQGAFAFRWTLLDC